MNLTFIDCLLVYLNINSQLHNWLLRFPKYHSNKNINIYHVLTVAFDAL